MIEDPMDNWKEKMVRHLRGEIDLLQNGASSSVTAMGIMSLKKRYKNIYGITEDD